MIKMSTFIHAIINKEEIDNMEHFYNEKTTIKDLCEDKDVGKYMLYLYYPKRYLDNVYNQTVVDSAKYGLAGFNFLKKNILEGRVKQYFVDEKKPDVSIIHVSHNNNSKVIFILSGGGLYSVCHGIEGLPIAARLFEKGFDVILVTYSIDDGGYKDGPLEDLASSIRYCLNHQEELSINMDNYSILGCSAAGFVTAHFGTTLHGYKKYDLPKPGLLGLIYPVITLRTCLNEQTAIYCLRREYSEENLHNWSVDEIVDENYPKTFITHSKDDPVVDFDNAERMVNSLEKYHIPYFFKAYKKGGHGFSIADFEEPKDWIDLFVNYCK